MSRRLSAFRLLRPRHWLLAVLAVQFILGMIYLLSVPLWQKTAIYDEPDFYTVVRFLHQNGRLPTDEDYPAGDAEAGQATQPPLYFLVAYPLVALFDNHQPVPPGVQPALICVGDAGYNAPVIRYPITSDYLSPGHGAVIAGYGLRLLNLLLGIAAVALTFQAGLILFPDQPVLALIAAALLAFEGNLVRLNSIIGNDPLLLALSAWNLLICAHLRWRIQRKWLILLFISVALALLTRIAGWALVAFDLPFLVVIGLNSRPAARPAPADRGRRGRAAPAERGRADLQHRHLRHAARTLQQPVRNHPRRPDPRADSDGHAPRHRRFHLPRIWRAACRRFSHAPPSAPGTGCCC